MKRLLPIFLLMAAISANAADLTIKSVRPDNSAVGADTIWRDRATATTTYAPTINCESNYSYSQGGGTKTVSTASGLFHLIVISSGIPASAGSAGLIIYDSTTTTDVTRPIAKFKNAAGIEGTYLFDVQVTSGIQVMQAASTTEWTISYR